jgi:hypothetical protein
MEASKARSMENTMSVRAHRLDVIDRTAYECAQSPSPSPSSGAPTAREHAESTRREHTPREHAESTPTRYRHSTSTDKKKSKLGQVFGFQVTTHYMMK